MPRDKFWFPTAKKCSNVKTLQGVWKTIYDTMKKLKQQEQRSPPLDAENWKKFLSKFNSNESQFTKNEEMITGKLLVQYHDVFARHRLDLDENTYCLVKLTPEHDRHVYLPNSATPVHFRDELLVK